MKKELELPIYEPKNLKLHSLPENIQKKIFNRDEIRGYLPCVHCGNLRIISDFGFVHKCSACNDKEYNIWNSL